MLDNPKWGFYFAMALFSVGIFGDILSGALKDPSAGTGLGSIDFWSAIRNILWADFTWLKQVDWGWIVAWVPFRAMSLVVDAQIAWNLRRLLPFYT